MNAATDPRLTEALALHQRGDVRGALARYNALLAERPNDAALLQYCGVAQAQLGNAAAASDFLTRAIVCNPADPNPYNHLASLAVRQNNLPQALALLQTAARHAPNHIDTLNSMAIVLKNMGREPEALAVLRRLVQLAPAALGPRVNLATVQFETGDAEGAIAAYHEAIKLAPFDENARTGLAEAYESLGRFAEARNQYLAVLNRQESHPLALIKLLELRTGTLDAHWIERATQLAARPDLRADQRIRLHHALGLYHDRQREYDLAFRHLQLGSEEQFRAEPFNSTGFSQLIDTIIQTLDAAFFRAAQTSGNPSARPIFILGMPRSGTTLLEQILASHPQVAGGGELTTLLRISAQWHYPQGLRDRGPDALVTMANQYLDALNGVSTTHPRITDKMPFNYVHLGLIALLFPNAKIVHARRDALDTCVSCFFTSFARNIQFAKNLSALGRYYVDYDRLMRHWHTVLPGRIHDLRYEDLVRDTRGSVERLLAYCELPWDAACLRFYETEREVRTPSRWQVRQPIYSQSVARWKHYEKYLEPLRRELARLPES